MNHQAEVAAGKRFAFGRYWLRFLSLLDDNRIARAKRSLCDMLDGDDLVGKTIPDIGSGSGLLSLAARRLGAKVHSFDFDPASVECTHDLPRRYCPNDPAWTVKQGSVLGIQYLARLRIFDVVYSLGVLHHTGSMWQEIDQATKNVAPGGSLYIAIYNDQRWISKYWLRVKQLFNKSIISRIPLMLVHAPYLLGVRFAVRLVTHCLSEERGMSLWYDMIDWLGGYPFEVATPDQMVDFLRKKDCWPERLRTCGGRHGCNQYVLRAHFPAMPNISR